MSRDRRIPFTRRQIVRGLLATGGFAATSQLWTSCSSSSTTQPSTETNRPADLLTMGFLYVGPKDDFGWNQAHAEGAAGVAKLPGVKIVE